MNICFYTYFKVCSTKGGTERTTVSVASSLSRYYQCRCFSLYEIETNTIKEGCFVDEFHWQIEKNWEHNISTLRKIIVDNKIDVIINQGTFIYVKHMKKAVEGVNCKIVLAHHFEPGAEAAFFSFRRTLSAIHCPTSFVDVCRWGKNVLMHPYLHMKFINSLHDAYREAYLYADCVVLLCYKFINQYKNFGRFEDEKKFVIIPNGLSFNEFITLPDIKEKKKIALIVSRLDDTHKRLSLALRIWGQIQKDKRTEGWSLNIVGEGPSMDSYQQFVRKYKIKNVLFCGRKNPMPYYKESAVFLMTSRSESWGLTLTEAQQMGVVPIAFNSYASLTEIVTDGKDGFVVKEGDINGYVNKLIELMLDEENRYIMAVHGVENSARFSQDKIAKLWWNLLSRF